MINKTPISDNFLSIIYITILKLMAITPTIVEILDTSTTRHVSSDKTRFLKLLTYENSCRI